MIQMAFESYASALFYLIFLFGENIDKFEEYIEKRKIRKVD